MMQASRWLTVFYVLSALVLLVFGVWGLADPAGMFARLHPEGTVDTVSTLLLRQAVMGLILAALVSLVCILTPKRVLLHLGVGLYLAGLVASHGEPALAGAAWLWLVPVAYLLPLFAPLLSRLPKPAIPLPGVNGREGGEVKWFNPNKGFGFIATDDGREIFVHFKAVQNGGRRSLRNGARVSFRTIETKRGEQADEVYIEND